MDERLAALEEKIAFLEQALNELSDEHFSQQRDIEKLNRRVERLIERLEHRAQSADGYSDSTLTGEEKPPHY